MKRLAFLISFVLATETIHGQDPSYNRANFFSAINPAFAVSPIDYNSLKLGLRSDTTGAFYGQINIDKLYSAVGLFTEYQGANSQQAGIFAAYHTYFLPKNYHLMGGAAARFHFTDSTTLFSSRYGVLLCGNPKSSSFFGLSFDTGTRQTNSYQTYSFQTGKSLMRISRKLGVVGYAVGNYYDFTIGIKDQKDILIQPMIWAASWSAGPGYFYDDRKGDKLLIRGSYWYKARFSLVVALPTESYLFQNLIYDFTIQYKF
ncbi:MAG: hypothetical protein ACKVOK_05885 [Flavobacteriales bacterium]